MRTTEEARDMELPGRPWHDTTLPVADRVELLLGQMTLEEKVAQLGSRWLGNDLPTGDQPAAEPATVDGSATRDAASSHIVAPMQDVFGAAAGVSLEEASRHGLGHLTRVYGSAPVSPAEGAAQLVRQQRVVLNGSRLDIPALVHEECLTGFTAYGATVYPAAIAWAATFDPGLVERMAAAIGRDMAAVGVHQGLSPVLDVVRDYRWGRVEETMGEDPHLVAVLGTAYVRGLQSAGVLATLKHFAGYSASRGARNHGPVPMGRRELLEVVLPPFEAAVIAAGAASVMNSYADVDGIPAGADHWLLTDLLRDEWGFGGTVVSDYWAVPFLASMHGVAADDDEAGALALSAGIDVELPDTLGFGPGLVERVRRGELAEALVDRAARRLLAQKVQLGLLDPDWTPEGSVAGAEAVELDSSANRALAADPLTFMGCYAFPAHVLPRHPDLGLGVEVATAVDALRAELPGVDIVTAAGCDVQGQDRSGFTDALEAAHGADLCVALVGDRAGLFGGGSSGEGCDAEDLRLPGVQADLLAELLGSGTPVVVVVVSGRPYALGDVHGRAAGLVQAFFPGEEGGQAIAGVLSGRVQPSGKLPVQVPRHPGGQPGTYLQPPLGAANTGTSSLDPTALFPFGYGTSYTTFALTDLRIDPAELTTNGEFRAVVRLRNTGSSAGEEVVQLYLHDVVAEVTRPVRQLAAFARVRLEPAEVADVHFLVPADATSFIGRELRRIVEPGDVDVLVGTSSTDLPCQGRVRLTGPVREVGLDRRSVTVDVLRRVADLIDAE